MGSTTPTRYHLRREWLKQASDGARATLIKQAPQLQEEFDVDPFFVDELFLVSMSKKGIPAFLWLSANYPPSRKVLCEGIAHLPSVIMDKALTGRPWPQAVAGKSHISITKALLQHPKGWKVALENVRLCLAAGMPWTDEGLYGTLYELAKLPPKSWARLSSGNEHAMAGLLSCGVKVKEWESRSTPESGHPLVCALESGNLRAAICLLGATSTRLTSVYLDALLDAVVGYSPKYSWPQDNALKREFLETILLRCENKKELFWEKARDPKRSRKVPPELLTAIEAGALEEKTAPATFSSRSRRL